MKVKTVGRKKTKIEDGRYADVVRPFLQFSTDENWTIENARVKLRLDKGEFLRLACLYVAKHGIDPRE